MGEARQERLEAHARTLVELYVEEARRPAALEALALLLGLAVVAGRGLELEEMIGHGG